MCVLRPGVPVTWVRNLKCPKWLGDGAKGVLARLDQKPAALMHERVALVQDTLRETISSAGQNKWEA